MNLAVLDLETTGVDPLNARIVEIAIVDESSNSLFHSYVNPGIPIPAEATAVHGIDWNKVATRPKLPELIGFIVDAIGDRTIGGYNAIAYDVPLLNAELARAGHPALANPVLDAFLMWKALEDRTLSSAVKHFCSRDLPGAHTALADACATADVIKAITQKYNLTDPAPVLAARFVLPGKIRDGRMTVGKHAGKLLTEIDVGYRQWILGQDFCPADKAAVHASLA